VTVAIAADLALNLIGVFSYSQHIKHVHMGEEPVEFLRQIVRDGPFSLSENEDECYTDLFVPRTYDNNFFAFNRSDSLIGRSGKGEKHFQGEKQFPYGRYIPTGSPELLSDLGRERRADLNRMGLHINLKGIMPSATAQAMHANKYSDIETVHSQDTRSQLEKMSARSFHSSDSNDSYNDSDMFYAVDTSRSGFSEGVCALHLCAVSVCVAYPLPPLTALFSRHRTGLWLCEVSQSVTSFIEMPNFSFPFTT
jgi:hypothetical protein